MEQIRSFIAINLPDELKMELNQLQAKLQASKQLPVKWVDPESIHLTLKFLGNIKISQLSDITTAIAKAARGIPPFRLNVSETGVFPNPRRAQIAWVGLSGDTDKLGKLQRNIDFNLARLGFAPESRPFSPHLTLARLRNHASPEERQAFGQLITNTGFEAKSTVNVKTINLMKSQLTKKGAIYSIIATIKL